MQASLSSGKYDIIASGETFLFAPLGDLTIQLNEESKTQIRVVLKFIEDNSGNFDIYNDIVDESMVITCANFNGVGTGLKHPVHIADTDGKAIYLMFSSTLLGNEENKTRSVKYTLFQEK